jgi:hypothetical protein
MHTLLAALTAALSVLLTSCTGGAATPNPSGPVLTGFDALPKQLATIYLSPTPDLPDMQATQVQATLSRILPTATLPPATPTPTLTPFVGVFLGAATFAPGDVANQKPLAGRGSSAAASNAGSSGGSIALPTQALVASPAASGANAGGAGGTVSTCATQPAPQFTAPSQNPLVRQQLGCPVAASFAVTLVQQPFQKGFMIWRDTRQIFVLSTAAIQQNASVDTLWIVADQWGEGMPANDPALTPPDGLLQPIRGFGLVWRSNTQIRDTLGWALAGEQPYQGAWQDFERGWMMTSADGRTFAVVPGNPTGVHFGPLQ